MKIKHVPHVASDAQASHSAEVTNGAANGHVESHDGKVHTTVGLVLDESGGSGASRPDNTGIECSIIPNNFKLPKRKHRQGRDICQGKC